MQRIKFNSAGHKTTLKKQHPVETQCIAPLQQTVHKNARNRGSIHCVSTTTYHLKKRYRHQTATLTNFFAFNRYYALHNTSFYLPLV
jgi:hypothetical protein